MLTPKSRRSTRRQRSQAIRSSGDGGDSAELAPVAWRRWVAIVIPLAAVLLGGATARWSEGLVLVAIGVFAVVAPPRVSAGRILNGVLLGLLLLAATAFLPAKWFSMPAWRSALVDDFGIALPATLSPQPVLAAESYALFLAGAAWFYLMVTFRWSSMDRLLAGRAFAGGVIGLAGCFLLLHKFGFMPPIWHNEGHFGSFRNRNQTADFLALGSMIILTTAHLRWQEKQRGEALAWMLGWSVVLLALFASFSRAGIVMLFGTVALYILLEIQRSAQRYRRANSQRSNAVAERVRFSLLNPQIRWTALGLSVLMLLLGFFFLFGGSTLERFYPASAHDTSRAVTGEFRLHLQADAVGMIKVSPWNGLGIGSFSEIFPLFRRRTAMPARAIHPESDYLWVAAEMGWPALVLIGVGVVYVGVRLGRSVPVSGNGNDRRLRLGAALALAAFCAHALVDVSAHRLGTVLCACSLLGLAIKDEKAEEAVPNAGVPTIEKPPAILPNSWTIIFRLGGGLLMAVGLIFLVEAAGWVLLPGQTGVDELRARAIREAAARQSEVAEADLTRALGWAPLDWDLYFRRASARLFLGRDQDSIAEDFRRARFLEPFVGDLPQAEAKLWITAGESSRAVSALGEACRREPDRAEFYIQGAMGAAGRDKDFLDALARFTRRDPALLVAFLNHSNTPETPGYIAEALKADPDLSKADPAQKAAFFRAWAVFGDAGALCAEMNKRPDWQAAGWRWWATATANTGHLEQACALAKKWSTPPKLPPMMPTELPLEELQRQAALESIDPSVAMQAYRAMSAAGDWRSAQTALRSIIRQRDCPAYFHFLEAEAAGRLSDWPRSWDGWNQYFAAAHVQD